VAYEFKDHLRAPPATAALFLFSRDEREISRDGNLCQICARGLLIWHVWTIWANGRTITYEQSTAVGVPIPSLATLFSIAYKHPVPRYCSILFQFRSHGLPGLPLPGNESVAGDVRHFGRAIKSAGSEGIGHTEVPGGSGKGGG
jgi:hypothetical protein